MFIYKRCRCHSSSPALEQGDASLVAAENTLKLLAVPARVRLLLLLSRGAHCVCDLMTHTRMSQTLISHHLADLMAGGVVEKKRAGKYIDYALTAQGKRLIRVLRLLNAPL
ncbi:MAG: metalloregulator ArsR/SmtB family transcription factor [Patescibacteria group bacterium]